MQKPQIICNRIHYICCKIQPMKHLFTLLAAVSLIATTFAQVGINTSSPHESAALDIVSTTGGLLVPRMTETQRDAITTPSQGLIIFCTDCASGEGELQVKLTSIWKSLHDGGDVNDPLSLAIGDTHQGGIVFYLDGSGGGLIAAVENQSNGIRWYNGSYVTTGTTGTAIGTGSANTTSIITEQGAPAISYAAGLARAYGGGGYTDWFLPSKDELNKMYENIGQGNVLGLGNVGNLSYSYYWSSTENGFYDAWRQSFISGNQTSPFKINSGNVRAVRAF